MTTSISYSLEVFVDQLRSQNIPHELQDIVDRYNRAYPDDQQIKVKTLKEWQVTGLSRRMADRLATAYDIPTWSIWPLWLEDDSVDAMYNPRPDTIDRYKGKNYRPGGLRCAIIEIATMHLGEPISPASVTRELGRSRPTQVYQQMRNLAEQGFLEKCVDKPARYILRAPLPDFGNSEDYIIEDEADQ